MSIQRTFSGLTSEQVSSSRKSNGDNVLKMKDDNVLLVVMKHVVLEPMFILLVIVAAIYFIVGQYQEGFIMIVALIIVSGISVFQNIRSRTAIKALSKFHSSNPLVIRDNVRQRILSEEVVTGDIIVVEEGEIIAADGLIRSSNDLSVDESILTGESFPVSKSALKADTVYRNTLVNSGSAIIEVTAVGRHTRVGGIGVLMKNVPSEPTSLELQIKSFLKYMVALGILAFALVVIFSYRQSSDIVKAALQGLTMAMSVLPEEIAVAFSTFMALGAFRLIKKNIIVRHPQYVESLGTATVICLDKTGTITENSMRIAYLYDPFQQKSISVETDELPAELLEYAVWASEVHPFDAMEKAIHKLYTKSTLTDRRSHFLQIHEYPLGGTPPMMTHIFKNDENEEVIIAAKGAPEAILRQSRLSDTEYKRYSEQALEFAKQGYRVLAVGKGFTRSQWPASQQEFEFQFMGLLIFEDPPKKNITEVIKAFNDAGIAVKLITGDYAETAVAIAGRVNIHNSSNVITGSEVMRLQEPELMRTVKDINIFARMYPEAKLKVISALKKNDEVVAMTGDGVNDAPALRAAHIGIAMGNKGSAVAKKASSLVITDDNLAHMVDAIALGRRIYDNLKKAIRYIISIHIPIIMIVSLPVLLNWKFSEIFTPVHVIFLELIMGPTCSIIFENEPAEPGIMHRKPLKAKAGFLLPSQLSLSVIQGLVIGIVCLVPGYYYMHSGASETTVLTIVFLILLFSNIILTLENRSMQQSVIKTLSYPNKLMRGIVLVNFIFIIIIMTVPAIREIFKLEMLSITAILGCFIVALVGTLWIEIWKYYSPGINHHK